MPKQIVFFDANQTVLPAIEYAKSRGIRVITCDNKANNPGHRLADEVLPISTFDYDQIQAYFSSHPVDGVIYFASGPGSYAGCRLIEEKKIPGISNTIKEILSYKNNFRTYLKEHEFTSFPQFVLFNGNVIPKEVMALKFPVIVKPTDCGGNNGITKVSTKNELQVAIDYAHSVSKSGNIIIEEFIETDLQINGDCIIENGKVVLSFLGKHVYTSYNDILPYSTIFGNGVIPQEIRNQIDNEIEKLVSSIGIKSGAINAEFRVSKTGKIYFIEVNSRHSGNHIYRLMNKAFDLSLEEIAVKLALDEPLNIKRNSHNGYFAYALLYSETNGIFDSIETSKKLDKYIVNKFIFKEAGDTVNKFSKLTDRLGLVLLQFPNFEEMQNTIENFKTFYKVNLKG